MLNIKFNNHSGLGGLLMDRVSGVLRVYRPAVGPDLFRVSEALLGLLGAVVTREAEALPIALIPK
jgi:hypothetical protein